VAITGAHRGMSWSRPLSCHWPVPSGRIQ
jgi:hypothetical protein